MASELNITLNVHGGSLGFKLWSRELDVGLADPITYCWMDISALRKQGSGSNGHSVVEHWWRETVANGLEHDAHSLVHLVLAELYPLVASDRGPQKIFRDGLLRPIRSQFLRKAGPRDAVREATIELDRDSIDGRDFYLPSDEWTRLRQMALERDLAGIHQEVKKLLIGDLPSDDELPAYQALLQAKLMEAIAEFKKGGHAELRRFLQGELLDWLKQCRRQGKRFSLPLFVNMISHEAKASFHLCYANAWRKLIPALMSQHALDPVSTRFMAIWHGVSTDDQDQRDPFWGLVPALHPLSERVMRQTHYRCAIGAWLRVASVRPEASWHCDEYWLLLASILAAANEYVELREKTNVPRRSPASP